MSDRDVEQQGRPPEQRATSRGPGAGAVGDHAHGHGSHGADAPPPPVEDHRVPGVKPDPLPAYGHLAEAPSDHRAAHAAAPPRRAPVPPALKAALDDMRAAAETAVLVTSMHQTGDRDGRWRFLNTLDRVDDPAVRAKMKAQFAAQTGKSLDDFVATTTWHSPRDREQAAELIGDRRGDTERSIATKSPHEQKKLRVQSIKWAEQVLAVTRKDDIDDDASAKAIFDTLGPRSPEEVEMIARARARARNSRPRTRPT